jgi:deoxycytidylate deaminase
MKRIKIVQAVELAKEAAELSDMRYRLGTCIFDKSQYVCGYNRCFHVKVPGRDTEYSIHAEELAIIRAARCGIRFEEAILVIVRINKKGDELKISKPCEVCQRLIEKVGIKEIWYKG